MELRDNTNEFIQVIEKIKENSPYIKEIAENAPSEKREFYHSFPVITKNVIMSHIKQYVDASKFQFVSDDLSKYLTETKELSSNHDRILTDEKGKKWIFETTTGSTGKPFTLIKDEREKLIESAFLFKKRKQHFDKVSIDNGFLLLQPVDPYIKELNYRGNSEKNIGKVVQYMLETKPKWLLTTALLLRKVYKYIETNGLQTEMHNLGLKFIESTSQKLEDEEKKSMENTFGCKIVNQFGCREVWNIAYECAYGNMHVNDKYLLIDLVDEKGKMITNYDEVGYIIVTSKLHQQFPLIKYYLGDRAHFLNRKCECGCSSQVIEFDSGREYQKLIGSEFYGNIIFRKLLRLIYFKYSEIGLQDIFVYQKDDSTLEISAVVKDDKQAFEKVFQNTLSYLLEDKVKYQLIFNYKDQLPHVVNEQKPEIFCNYLK